MLSNEILQKLIPLTDEEKGYLAGKNEINRSLYMEMGSNIIKRQKLSGAGKLISIRMHPRFVHFPEHTHDYVEVIYMCKGTTTHIIDGNKIVLNEGELLFLGQNTRQEIEAAGENDISVNFIIKPDFFDSPLQLISEEETPLKQFVVDCLKNNGNNSRYLHFNVSDILPIQNLIENLIWMLIYGSNTKRKLNETTMGLLFLQLLEFTDRLSYKDEQERTVMQVLRYVENNYREASLKELCDKLHYDICTLSREIKQKTGKTFTELVQEKRLSQSSFLLRNTDMRVSEVAISVGYDNISYFHRIFNKKYGMSPKKYRDEVK